MYIILFTILVIFYFIEFLSRINLQFVKSSFIFIILSNIQYITNKNFHNVKEF